MSDGGREGGGAECYDDGGCTALARTLTQTHMHVQLICIHTSVSITRTSSLESSSSHAVAVAVLCSSWLAQTLTYEHALVHTHRGASFCINTHGTRIYNRLDKHTHTRTRKKTKHNINTHQTEPNPDQSKHTEFIACTLVLSDVVVIITRMQYIQSGLRNKVECSHTHDVHV